MLKGLIKWPGRVARSKQLIDTRPCAVCGLAPKIKLKNADMGQFCLYYGVRIPVDEANQIQRGLRALCLQDGNHFTWPVLGYSAEKLLQWRMTHVDWHLKRSALKVGAFAGVISLIISGVALIMRMPG